jgi:hypothetical protein
MYHAQGICEIYIQNRAEILKGGSHLGDLGVEQRIILK